MLKQLNTLLFKQQQKQLIKNSVQYNIQHNLNFTDQNLQQYQEDGYTVMNEVIDPEQLDQVIKYTSEMIQKDEIIKKKATLFESGKAMRGDDFLKTGDKIHYFFESDAFNKKTGRLQVQPEVALNKIGHAQHDLNRFFENFCYQKVFGDILKKVGYVNPRLVQSMYIFKNPKIGAEVVPHTDNTYLITNPSSTMGIWIALHDATVENGCMWGIPKSHTKKTEHFMYRTDDNMNTEYVGPDPNYDLTGQVPLEVKKGSIILLNGDFVHFSRHNSSLNPRHAFTLHVTEGESEGYQWHEKNWMQRTEKLPFRDFYRVSNQVQLRN